MLILIYIKPNNYLVSHVIIEVCIVDKGFKSGSFQNSRLRWDLIVKRKINAFNYKYLQWHNPCLDLEHTIWVCRGTRLVSYIDRESELVCICI